VGAVAIVSGAVLHSAILFAGVIASLSVLLFFTFRSRRQIRSSREHIQRALMRMTVGGTLFSAAPAVAYPLRGAYFTSPPAAYLVVGIVLAAAITSICTGTAIRLVLIKRREPRLWAVAAVLASLFGLALVIRIEPDLARVQRAIEDSKIDVAERELSACDQTEPSVPHLWSEIHMRRTLASSSCATATEHARLIAADDIVRVRIATAHADGLALTKLHDAVEILDVHAEDAAIGCMSPSMASSAEVVRLRAKALVLRGARCVAASEWSCGLARAREMESLGANTDAQQLRLAITQGVEGQIEQLAARANKEKDLDLRLEQRRWALKLWNDFLATTSKPEPPRIVALRRAELRDDIIHDQRVELERRRQKVAAKQQKAREEQEERRRQEAERRRTRYRELYCNDGTVSPTCACNRTSFQGCCSHHGGIRGCQWTYE
jgi:hypothetical protein